MANDSQRRLLMTLSITFGIFAAEVIGALMSNSLALLSDAAHVLTDSFALIISLVASYISRRPRDAGATYGYHRVGLLAALINGAALLLIATFIFTESWKRLMHPPEVNLALMMPVAVGGLLANLLMVRILGQGGTGDLNVKSAWMHVLGDTLSSVGVIVSGIVIYYTGWRYADPLTGFLIGIVIVIGGARVIRESVVIFLDLVPKGYDIGHLADVIRETDGVEGVHDVHLRSIAYHRVAFSAHIRVRDMMLSEIDRLRAEIEERLSAEGINHTTLQIEANGCENTEILCELCSDDNKEYDHSHFHGPGSGHGH